MKKTNLVYSVLVLCGLLLLSREVFAAGNASTLKIKVYAVGLSTNTDCSNPVTLFSKTTPEETDFLTGPTLGAGDVPDGSYKCVLINMSDNIVFTAASASARCTAGTEYTLDICRSDGGGTTTLWDPATGAIATTAATACTGTSSPQVFGDDIVTLFISTAVSDSAEANAFASPALSLENGRQLISGVTIGGAASAKFVVDATGKVDANENSSNCDMDAPTFSFEQL